MGSKSDKKQKIIISPKQNKIKKDNNKSGVIVVSKKVVDKSTISKASAEVVVNLKTISTNQKLATNSVEKQPNSISLVNEVAHTSSSANALQLPITQNNSNNSTDNILSSSIGTKSMVDYVLRQRMSDFLRAEVNRKNQKSKTFSIKKDKKQANEQKSSIIVQQITKQDKIEEIKKDIEESTIILKKIAERNKVNPYTSARAKLALTAGLSLSGVVAVANIPTSAIVSQERVVENLNIQLNILTEKNTKQSYMQTAHLDKSDSLSTLFKKLGIDDIKAENFVKNNTLAKFLLLTKPQYSITAEVNENKELLSLKAIIHSTQANAVWLKIERNQAGELTSSKEIVSHVIETEVRSGSIDDADFFSSMDKAGVEDSVTKQMIDIFSSTVNFHHDIKKGDKFRLVFERLVNQNEFIGHGRIIAAEIVNKKGVHQAIWYPKESQYYTFGGEALKRSFLQAPLEVSRVTSAFGNRHHPIHGYSHKHTGVDFAAPSGTNVFSSADGIVDFVGTQSGYGKIIIIKHGKGVSTYYAHLSGFNSLKLGQVVRQGDLIGFVGMTGSATGPHLHYEYRVDNSPQNPLSIISEGLQTLAGADKQDFVDYTRGIMKQVQALRDFDLNNQL
jgi:murein DD-endopeptidase MepM/ murein hydrolase activator NlpD